MSEGVSKHIQTVAHSAKEAESGDSRGTDYADATPAGSIAANLKMARTILLLQYDSLNPPNRQMLFKLPSKRPF